MAPLSFQLLLHSKYTVPGLLFSPNLCWCQVISAGILVVGTWVAVSKETFIDLYINITTSTSPLSPTEEKDANTLLQEFVEPAVIDQAGYLLIALGAFIFIISFLGYCGSIKESRVLLTAYGIFLIIIFCLQVRYK